GVQKTNDFASDNTWHCSETVQTPLASRAALPGEGGVARAASGVNNIDSATITWTNAVKLGDPGMIPWRVTKNYLVTRIASAYPGKIRASLVAADPLMTALGRPNREQVVTTRSSVATTLQALEMTNGETLVDILKRGADNLLNDPAMAKKSLIPTLYERALGRKPTEPELKLAQNIVGKPVQPAGVEDLLWSLTMLPEFQLIY